MNHTSLALAAVLTADLCAAAPCTGAVTQLREAQRDSYAQAAERRLRTKLPPELALQVRVGTSDVLSYLKFGKWVILQVETHATDSPYLIYSATPDQAETYAALWAGAARKGEGNEIERWVLSDVPNSTKEFAACFAWVATRSAPK